MASELHTETQVPGADAHAKGPFPPFDGTTFPSQLLWLAITFGLLYYIMSKVALPRIAGILEDREDRIAGDVSEAERLKRESDEALAAYEQALAEARHKAHGIARATRDKLEADVEARRQAAEDGLQAKLAEAEASIAAIKTAAMAEVDGIATDTAEEIVKALVGGTPTRQELTDAVSASLNG